VMERDFCVYKILERGKGHDWGYMWLPSTLVSVPPPMEEHVIVFDSTNPKWQWRINQKSQRAGQRCGWNITESLFGLVANTAFFSHAWRRKPCSRKIHSTARTVKHLKSWMQRNTLIRPFLTM
jgi:hypothetical protein